MENFIRINGISVPQPRRGLNLEVATIVNSRRNGNGVMTGQKVGRDQQKIDALEWGHLTAAQWSVILQECDKFHIMVTYPDMVTGTWTTRKMYPGNRTATPLWIDPETGLPTDYINCKVNIIDVGEDL